jgi:hypothetical protein
MKRSEMIQYIVDEIGDINSALEQIGNEDYSSFMKRKAAGMLDMIEGFGMLPPKANILSKNFKTVKYDKDGTRLEGDWYESLTQWEPEDE